jgi:cell division protein FtsI (penicillin-binding protein 3)
VTAASERKAGRGAGRSDRGSAGRERVGFNANPLLMVAIPAWRSKLMLFGLFVGFVALGGRAFYLMGGVTTEFLQRQGEARYARTLDIPATRGRVTDRNGIVLASSVPARAVWAIPEDVEASPVQVAELARLLDMNAGELKRRLANDDRSFVYLRRQVDVEIMDRITALKIPRCALEPGVQAALS